MNSGWLSFKLKLEQHLSEAARLIKRLYFAAVEGMGPSIVE